MLAKKFKSRQPIRPLRTATAQSNGVKSNAKASAETPSTNHQDPQIKRSKSNRAMWNISNVRKSSEEIVKQTNFNSI